MFLQLILVLVVLIPILAIVLDSQVGRALASRLEGRSPQEGGSVDVDRLAFLEGEVERLSREIERLDEESRFFQSLLEERTADKNPQLGPGDDAD